MGKILRMYICIILRRLRAINCVGLCGIYRRSGQHFGSVDLAAFLVDDEYR